MTSYFQRKSKHKLFQQWVKDSGLPPEEVPANLTDEQHEEVPDTGEYNIPFDGVNPVQKGRIALDQGMVQLPIRYVVIMLSAIAALLVTLSVIITILIAR
jgi:hypothetical protein